MSWIDKHKNVWRGVILVGVLVAVVGPWTFDHVWVPSEHRCCAPWLRLNDNFCGIPLPGTWLFCFMAIGFISASARLVAGGGDAVKQARELLIGIVLFLLVLPVLSTLLSVLSGDHRRRQVLNVAAWVLAAGMGLLIGVSSHPRLFWVLWGLWLYIGLAASALILEALTLAAGRRINKG
jgi:hypothetical protein